MNKYAVWKLKGIDGPNTGPVKVVGVATGDEIETGVVVEGEEATTGAEVANGEEDDVITGAVIGAGRVFTTEAVVGADKEEVTAGAAGFCTTLAAWYWAARWRFFSL